MIVMQGLENQTYMIGYLISNAVAILMLLCAWKWPWISRLLFFILFAWACWINWKTAMETPQVYLDYADLTPSKVYKKFIRGWFSGHIQPVVGFIATSQGLIAVAMLLRGGIFKAGLMGGIIFLLAILPFGVGSGFPATLLLAAAMAVLFRGNADFVGRNILPNKRRKTKYLTQSQHPVNH